MSGDTRRGRAGAALKWHYSRDGARRGPVSSRDLQALATRGDLLPTDLIWKEGMKDWVRADRSSVVFPSSSTDPSPSSATCGNTLPTDVVTATPPTIQPSTRATLTSAGSLIAKKTERTKLATVTIPRAYAELGKTVYKDAGKRGAFTSLFEQLDSLLAQRKKIHNDAKARPPASTFADKAKQVANDATDLAKTKALDLKIHQAFASLGESAYTQVGADVGPQEVIAPLATAIARRDALDKETASIEHSAKGQWITPRRLVFGGGALLALIVLGMIAPDKAKIEGGAKEQTRTPRSRTVTKVGKGSEHHQKPTRTESADVATAPTGIPAKTPPKSEPTDQSETITPAEPKRVSTQKTYYPNGQLHEEITLADENKDGTSRAWYSNGSLRDEMTFKNGVLAKGRYLARSGKAIFEYQLERQWTPQMSSFDFSHAPDGQEVRPYTDTREIIPVVDVKKDGFGAVDSFVDDSKKPRGGWPVIALKASVYTDDDLGEVFHGVVSWETTNSLKASDFRFDDATSMKYDGTGSISHVASRRHGPFLLFYPSGVKWVEATFVNNLLHGTATVWHENGQIRDEIPFVAGQWDGAYRAWHANGKKAIELTFERGKREGIRRKWNDSGTLLEEGLYRDGEKEGTHNAWWPNGQMGAEKTYKAGVLNGKTREWTERGVTVVDVAYENGIPQGSKVFADAVSRLRGIGFTVQPCTVVKTAEGYRHLGSAIGIKSDGENDLVVCVSEFMPIRAEPSDESGPVHDAIVSRAALGQYVGYMHSSISQMPDGVGKTLLFTDPENSRGVKTLQNGSTEFVGIMLIGDKQCEVTWHAANRFSPDPEVWKVESGGQVIMTADDYHTDQRPSVTRIIMGLLGGGIRW